MLESRADLGLQREEALTASWSNKRIKVEQDMQTCYRDPSLPVAFLEDLTFNAYVLDHMLTRVPERARMFGEGAEVAAWGSLRLLEGVIEAIRTGIPETQLTGADELRMKGLL